MCSLLTAAAENEDIGRQLTALDASCLLSARLATPGAAERMVGALLS